MPKLNPATGLREGLKPLQVDPRTGMPAAQSKSQFQKGLRSGMEQLSSISSGVEGAAQAFAGDNEAADAAVMESQKFQERAQQFGPRIQNVDEVNDIDAFTDWAVGAIGQQIPIMASMVVGGPAGVGVRGAVRAALPKAALPSTAAAATTGMVTSASGLETGSIFPELQSDMSIRETTTPRERAVTALGFGTVAGSLEALPFIGITKRFGVDKAATGAIKKSVGKAISKGAITQGALEAGTEGAQTIVERAAHKFLNDNADIFTEEGLSEMRNAIAAGGLLGGGIGGFGGAIQGAMQEGSDSFDAIGQQISDMEIGDQLGGARVKNTLSQLRTRFEGRQGVTDEIDAVLGDDLQDPDVQKQAIKFSQALSEISTTEDVLGERGLLGDTGEQMNDVLTISEYARDPELIDTDVLEELDKRYGSDQGSVFDIIDDIRDRFDPEFKEAGEAAITGFETEEGGVGGKELEGDFEVSPTFVTEVDFRAEVETAKAKSKERGGKPVSAFEVADALTDAQAKQQVSTLVDEKTGITGFGEEDSVTSGGFVYTKVPLSEMVVESVKQGQTRSLRMRDKSGRLTDTKPTLISEGGKYTAEQVVEGAAQKLLKTKSGKQLWEAIKPSENAAFDAQKVEALKAQATSDPKQFLSNFFAIKKQKMVADTSPIVAASADDTTISLGKVDVKPTSDVRVKKSIVRNIPNQGLTGARAKAEVPLVQIVRGEDGKPKRKDTKQRLSVNFPSLIGRALGQLSKATKTGSLGHTTDANIARAFREGVTSLFADHGLIISNISKIPDNTTIFVHSRKVKNEETGKFENKITTMGDIRAYIKEKRGAEAALPDFKSGVEGKTRATNLSVEAALEDLFESNKTGTGEFEGGFTLEDMDRGAVEKFIDRALVGGLKARETGFRNVIPRTGKPTVKVTKKKKRKVAKRAVPDKVIMPSVLSTAIKWRKQLGLKDFKLLTVGEAVEALKIADRPNMISKDALGNEIVSTSYNGFASEQGIYINPNISQAAQLETLAHEVGHLVVTQHVNITNAAAIDKAFQAWRDELQARPGAKLSDVVKSKMTIHMAVRAMTGNVDAELQSMSKADLQYLLDFEEWFADNTARFLADDTIIPKNAVERFFKQLVAKLRKLFADFKGDPDKQVAKFLRALDTTGKSAVFNQAQDNMEEAAAKNIQGIKMSKNGRDGVLNGETIGAYLASSDPYDTQGRVAIARWLDSSLIQEEKLILTNAFKVPSARAKIEELTGSMAAAPLQSMAAGVQLWIAGEIELGPKSTNVMGKVLKWLRNFLQINDTESKAEAILEALQESRISGQLEERTFFLKDTYIDTLTARVANVVYEQGSRMMGYLEAYTFTADSRMQTIPALQEIAKLFHARVGNEKGTTETYFEARATNVGKYTDRVERILEGMDDAAKARILKDAQQEYGGKLSMEERARSNAMRKLFDDMYKYAEANGVATMMNKGEVSQKAIKFRKNYFPVMYDTQYMMDHRDEFIAMLRKPKYGRFFKEDGSGPEGLYTHLVENMGYGDTPVNPTTNRVGFTPAMSAVNQRTLDWIDAKDREPFLNKSLEYTMVQYIDSLVKRAEYTKRFDTDGRHLEELLKKAQDSGATTAQMKMAENYVNASLGTLGQETNNKLYALFGKTPTPGQVINPTLQKAMSSVIVFRNLAVL